jgi:serine/threonine-protein kinase
MSPEQIVGDTAIDARSDVWSLGVVTYEAVTGVSCFEGANVPQLMMSIGKGIYRPASQVRADLPRGIDAFFARALAGKARDRFASASELAAAFRALLVEPRRSNRGVVIGAVAVLTAIACVGLFAVVRSLEPASSAPVAPLSTAVITAPSHDVPPPIAPPTSSDSPTSSPSTTPRVTTTSRVKSTTTAAPPVPTVAPVVTTAPAPVPPPTAEPPRPKKRIDPREIQ